MVPEDEPPEDQEATPLVPEPSERDPAEREPAEREPTEREPAEREPAEREPAEREPAERQPSEREPAEREPAERQPSECEPAEREPAERQPSGREPAGRQPAERPSSATALPRIDGYRIEGVLGRGSTGVVYSAVQLAVDRPVALKILHANLVGTKRAVRRLQREARTAARLAHPSIITAIDMGEQDGQWWYAMELVEGISLADRIKEKGVFTEREALRFFIPLCDALQHAYEGGVVHRDIKPANILIDAHGSARLVDLGLAFAEDDPLITAPGGTLGTPHYISPEQAKDPSSADSQSDLWSLGATMYHALCGRPPFAGASVAEILSGVLYGRVPEPRKFAPQLSKGMSLVLRKCLTRDPERRYREPAQLERDLERIRERRSPHVRAANLDPVDTGRPAWVGRALAMGGVGLAVLVGTLLITRPWEERGGGSMQGGSGQTGWAELENLRQDFEAGDETHARTLETLGMLVAPEGFDTSRTDFSAKVISDLSFRVVQLTDELGVDLESRCLEHDFQAARSRLDGLAQALRDRTGFIEVSALPDKARRHLKNWSGTQRELLGAARREAVTAGIAHLETYFEGTLVPGFEQLTGKHRWRDALDSLEPKDAWLGGEGAGVDLRGLNAAEQQRILDSVRSARTAKIREARNAYHRLDGELANFVEDERQVLQDKIRNGTVQDASAVLGRAYRGERQARGVDPAQIPWEWLQPGGVLVGSTLKLDRARSDLEDFEARTLRERALLLFPGNDRTASRLCSDRRYSQAAAFWEQRLEDQATVAVHPRMRMRLREMRHLEALLAQAADGVRLRRGLEFLPVIDGIEFNGVILTAADVLERGFQLRPHEKNFEDLLVHLVRPDPLPKDERLLGATYVLELADLGASALDRYRSALFLFYENQLQKAAERLPHEDPEQEFSDLLDGTDGLRERIQAALARLGRDRREEQESMALLIRRIRRGVDTGATPDRLQQHISTLFEAYGDLLDPTIAKDMRALERELASKTAPATMFESYGVSPELSRNRGVRLTWTFDREGLGSWEAGDWAALPESLQLLSPRDGDPEFWSRERSLHLPLVSPLDLQAGFKLTLELQTNQPEAERHQLVVSALGAHAIFLEDDDHPVFLAGAGDGRELLAEARASSTRESSGVGNLPRGRPFELVLEVRPNSSGKLLVWLDGEQLRVDRQRTWKIGEKPEVRLHSMLPLELLSVSIEGQRLAGTQ